jgi:hypothetical protein
LAPHAGAFTIPRISPTLPKVSEDGRLGTFELGLGTLKLGFGTLTLELWNFGTLELVNQMFNSDSNVYTRQQ